MVSAEQDQIQEQVKEDFLKTVKRVFMVMSGKGGVGKSTMAASIAVSFAEQGLRTGLLDIDMHGPSIAGMMGLTALPLNTENGKIQPYPYSENLGIISMQGFLQNPDDAVIWRGPLKIGVIRQLLTDVAWGNLDVLIIDSPPGTGDEPLTVAQFIPNCEAIVVTTPQKVALADVRKSITFCRQVGMKITGIIENMSGYVCPQCGHCAPIFMAGGGCELAAESKVPFLGQVPIDPMIVMSGDEGVPAVKKSAVLKQVIDQLTKDILAAEAVKKGKGIQIAIPLVGGVLSSHFGHCEQFAFFSAIDGKVTSSEKLIPPPHEPGVIPAWLADKGANVVLVGGMGGKAQEILRAKGVEVICGVKSENPIEIVELYLSGNLTDGGNSCSHDGDEHHECGH